MTFIWFGLSHKLTLEICWNALSSRWTLSYYILPFVVLCTRIIFLNTLTPDVPAQLTSRKDEFYWIWKRFISFYLSLWRVLHFFAPSETVIKLITRNCSCLLTAGWLSICAATFGLILNFMKIVKETKLQEHEWEYQQLEHVKGYIGEGRPGTKRRKPAR